MTKSLPDPTKLMSSIADMKARQANPQIGAFEVLLEIIAEFEGDLDEDHELGAHVANVDVPFHVRNVRRRGALFLFEGVDDKDQKVIAAQHYSQLSLQLVKLRKLKDRPSRIGFLSSS